VGGVQYGRFLPRDAMLTQYMPSSCICPSFSVCVSVTLWYCVKTAKRRITQIGIFCSCRISTDKRVARSLCHSRATCINYQVARQNHASRVCVSRFARSWPQNRALRDCGLCIALRARDTDRKSDCPIIIIQITKRFC